METINIAGIEQIAEAIEFVAGAILFLGIAIFVRGL